MVDDFEDFFKGQKPVFLKHLWKENFDYIPCNSLRTRLCWPSLAGNSVICILILDLSLSIPYLPLFKSVENSTDLHEANQGILLTIDSCLSLYRQVTIFLGSLENMKLVFTSAWTQVKAANIDTARCC